MTPIQLRAAAMLRLMQMRQVESGFDDERDGLQKKFEAELIVKSREERALLQRRDPYAAAYLAWSPFQQESYEAYLQCAWTFFGGAKGGGKSVGGARIAQRLISSSRGGVWLVIRRNYTDLKLTTKESYEKFFPPDLVISKLEDKWRCVNDWEIWFYSTDERTDKDYKKIGGLEVTGVHADELGELPESFYQIVSTTLRREAFDLRTGNSIHRAIYGTGNPTRGQHWTKRYFVKEATRRTKTYVNPQGTLVPHTFIQSLPDNNPMLPEGYIDSAFGTMDGALLEMFRYGNWDLIESDFKLFIDDLILGARIESLTKHEPCYGSLDVAAGGDDAVVGLGNEAGEMWIEKAFKERDTMKIIDLLDPYIPIIKKRRGKFFVDRTGLGVGIVDRLVQLYGDATIVGVDFGASADENEKYLNKRAEIYFWLREDLYQRHAKVFPKEPEMHSKLEEDLEEIYYEPRDGKLKLEAKDTISKRLARSPDYSDAMVLCNCARRKFMQVSAVIAEPIQDSFKSKFNQWG